MANSPIGDYELEFDERFAWRRERQISNFRELSILAGPAKDIGSLPGLLGALVSDDPKDALRWSALGLWMEAQECYVFGQFQACILACGAVVERCLKLEYEKIKSPLPPGAKWTLGKVVIKCEGIVDPDALEFARQIRDPRNSRAHALLEHEHPQQSILGGPGRGIEIRRSSHYLIDPFRGDAAEALELTSRILIALYGKLNRSGT